MQVKTNKVVLEGACALGKPFALDVRGLLPRGGTMLGSTNRANPFHSV